jgi:hypothetical protein
MREITHLVLLGRVSGGTAKKGDIELSEQELRRASGGIRAWPSRYRRGLLLAPQKSMLSGTPRCTVRVGDGSN